MPAERIRLERGSLLSLLDEAVVLARRVFGRVFPATAIPPALLLGLVTVVQFRNMRSLLPAAEGGSVGILFAGAGLSFLTYLLYGASTGLANAAMVEGTTREMEGREVRGLALWRWVFGGKVLGTLTLMGLLIGGGFLLCFLPGLYLAVVYALAIPIMAGEGLSGYGVLSRSRTLVLHTTEKRTFSPGLGWVIVVFLTAVVLSYGVSLAIQFPISVLGQLFLVRNILGEAARQAQAVRNPMAVFPTWFLGLQLVAAVLSGLAKQAVALYSAAAFTLLFRRLRGRREGTDLVAALDAMGAPE